MSITEFEKIQFYLAPMESVTGYVYRNAYHAMFGDMDKYVTPFIAPSKKKLLRRGSERTWHRSTIRECMLFHRS